MISLVDVLTDVFEDKNNRYVSRYVKHNKEIMLSCDAKYILPLYLCFKDDTKINICNFTLNGTKTFFKDLHLKLVTHTESNDEAYVVIGFKAFHDESCISYKELFKKFPIGSKIDYETYKKYENDFLYWDYDFTYDIVSQCVVVHKNFKEI